MKRLFLFAAIVSSFVAYGQRVKNDSLKTVELQEVVVTGQYEAQSIKKSVYQVRTISSERIRSKGASNLQDILNTELNFRFNQDLALGGAGVVMNGMSGQYVKVLIDGVPVIGKQGTGNEINLNQINVNTIERIEIVDGPMAVAYGADAMAGVINIITEKAYDDKLSLSARVQEETAGDEYGTNKGIHLQNVAASYSAKAFYGKLEAGRNYFAGWKGDSTARELEWHKKTQLTGAGVVGWKKNNTNIYYRLDALNETLYNPGNFSNGIAFDQKYITSRLMHQLQAEAKISSRLSYNGAIAFTDYYRKTQSVNVNESTGKETLSLGDGQQDKTTFIGLTTRGTFQYKLSNKLSFQPGYDINVDQGEGGRILAGSHAIKDYAFFISAEYAPTEFFSIRPGVRIIENSQYQAPPFIPSVNTRFRLSDRADLRVSYGRGFRAPSLRELYFDFHDASHDVVGNPNLEAELSHSVNGSFTYHVIRLAQSNLQSSVSAFYNDVDNLITTVAQPSSGLTTYTNIDKFKSKGFLLNNKFTHGNLDVSLGFSYTGRLNEFYESDNSLDEFTWSPEVNSNLSYRFPNIGLTTSLYYKFTGNLPYYENVVVDNKSVVRLATIKSFHWGDLSIQKSLFKYVDLTVGIRNVFDVGRVQNTSLASGGHSTAGPKPVGYGRSYFITVNVRITK